MNIDNTYIMTNAIIVAIATRTFGCCRRNWTHTLIVSSRIHADQRRFICSYDKGVVVGSMLSVAAIVAPGHQTHVNSNSADSAADGCSEVADVSGDETFDCRSAHVDSLSFTFTCNMTQIADVQVLINTHLSRL